jgi:peptidoglycan/xylan/chitin deacetylase (PgdA/CDA1 family)
MLNFRNTTIGFLILLAVFAVISIYSVTGYILMVALGIIYLLLLVFGSVFVCSDFYVEAFCSAGTDEKIIALTFDDGPHPEITPRVLDMLLKHEIQAMFFVIGSNITDNQLIMERMVREGHVVGNHSFSHSTLFDLWSNRQMSEDIKKAENIIALATGKRPQWFRPPFGVTNPTVAVATHKMGLKVMGWSIRSLDTSIKNVEKIFNRIKKRWRPGGIILLHDTNERVVDVLEMTIVYAKKQGYKFVRADLL